MVFAWDKLSFSSCPQFNDKRSRSALTPTHITLFSLGASHIGLWSSDSQRALELL
jgi:uncharacterized protein YcgI (DUF1989 family)